VLVRRDTLSQGWSQAATASTREIHGNQFMQLNRRDIHF
jgi:hypothetical protein